MQHLAAMFLENLGLRFDETLRWHHTACIVQLREGGHPYTCYIERRPNLWNDTKPPDRHCRLNLSRAF